MQPTHRFGIVSRSARLQQPFLSGLLAGGLMASVLATNALAQDPPPPSTPPSTAPATPPASPDAAADIAALRADLAAAKARIAELEAELAALKAAAAPQTPPAPGGATKGDASGEPTEAERQIASISDFLAKAKARYATALPEPAEGQPAPTAATRQRALERFVTSMNRSWRQTIEWNVRVVKSERVGDGVVLTVQQLDDHGADLGDPFPVSIEARRVRRLEASYMKAQPTDPFLLRAEFAPTLVVDNNRLEPGVFNNPPLIGPAVELRYMISAEALAPVRQRGEKPNGKPADKPATPGTGSGTGAPTR